MSVKITNVEVYVDNKKCIFNSNADCERFVHGEYICIVFRERCNNLKYRMNRVESESGEIISLSFKEGV